MTEAAASDPPAGHAGGFRLPSDDRLTLRAAEGDERAFAAIFDRYHQDLYRFCLAIVRNPQDAQDALQNAMVKVLRALPGETRRIELKPWLYRIAHNEAVELLRRRRDSVALEPELTASGAGLAETAATRERLRRLLGDIAELPERQRAALVMRELAGVEFGEIGTAFDTSDAVARQTVYEARLSLRQMEAGREMSCKKVMWELSEADGRVARRRDIQAHLRACPECRAFRDGIATRHRDFTAIAPLPLAVSAGLLQGLLGANAAAAGWGTAAGAGAAGGAGTGTVAGAQAIGTGAVGAGVSAGGAAAGGAGLAGTAAAGAGSVVATSAVLKAAATVAIVATGVTAADRGGLIETPLPSSIGGAKSSGPAPGATPAGAQPRSDRDATTGATGAGATERGGRGGPDARRGAKGERAGKTARGRDGHSGNGPGSARGGKANGSSRAKGHGRPAGPPAASGQGQRAAAGSSRGKSKGGGSKRGKAKARPPRKSHPPRGSRGGGRSGGKTAPAPKKPASPTAPAEQAPPPLAGSSTAEGTATEAPSPEG